MNSSTKASDTHGLYSATTLIKFIKLHTRHSMESQLKRRPSKVVQELIHGKKASIDTSPLLETFPASFS